MNNYFNMITPTPEEVIIIKKLQQVSWEISNLNIEDVEGHIWWNRFKEFLIKGTPIVECKKCEGSGFYYDYCSYGLKGECESCPHCQQCEECGCNGYLIEDVINGVNVKIINEQGEELPF